LTVDTWAVAALACAALAHAGCGRRLIGRLPSPDGAGETPMVDARGTPDSDTGATPDGSAAADGAAGSGGHGGAGGTVGAGGGGGGAAGAGGGSGGTAAGGADAADGGVDAADGGADAIDRRHGVLSHGGGRRRQRRLFQLDGERLNAAEPINGCRPHRRWHCLD
jgi:hypothetical protein